MCAWVAQEEEEEKEGTRREDRSLVRALSLRFWWSGDEGRPSERRVIHWDLWPCAPPGTTCHAALPACVGERGVVSVGQPQAGEGGEIPLFVNRWDFKRDRLPNRLLLWRHQGPGTAANGTSTRKD